MCVSAYYHNRILSPFKQLPCEKDNALHRRSFIFGYNVFVENGGFPTYLNQLVGRDTELTTLRHLFMSDKVRLLTLTGPGGIGKTRLAVKLLTQLHDKLDGKIYFVDLVALRDRSQLHNYILASLDIRSPTELPPRQALNRFFAAQKSCLLLDNFEQIIDAAPQIGTLLRENPTLKLVVTSRESLRVQGEHEFQVPPLSWPDIQRKQHHGQARADLLQSYPAIGLFVEHWRALHPQKELNTADLDIVAQICQLLDGLPLAIELAVARTVMFPLGTLLEQLQSKQVGSLSLLRSRRRDRPDRQNTLHNTIQWSYDLLLLREQQLFRRLAVFAGGFRLDDLVNLLNTLNSEAAIALPIVADQIQSLLEKSLVILDDSYNTPRYKLLTLIQEFADEQLAASDEQAQARDAHAHCYLQLSERISGRLEQEPHLSALARLAEDLDNLSVALRYFADQQQSELALRFLIAVSEFWLFAQHWHIGYNLIQTVFATLPPLSGSESNDQLRLWARALRKAGYVTHVQGAVQAREFLERSLALAKQIGDPELIADASVLLARTTYGRRGESGETMHALLRQAMAIYSENGNELGIIQTLHGLWRDAFRAGQFEQAQRLLDEMRQRQSRVKSHWYSIILPYLEAHQALMIGDFPRTIEKVEEHRAKILAAGTFDMVGVSADIIKALALINLGEVEAAERVLDFDNIPIQHRIGQRHRVLLNCALGQLCYAKGNPAAAERYLQEIVPIALESHPYPSMACMVYEDLARLYGHKRPEEAVELLSAAAALRQAHQCPVEPSRKHIVDKASELCLQQLNPLALEQAWNKGIQRWLDEALSPAPLPKSPSRSQDAYQLTPRELEVLALVTQGQSNAQIASALTLSERTVHAHLRSIFSKLAVNNRVEATTLALAEQLV